MNAFGPQPDSTELSDERLPALGSDADPRLRSRPDGDVTTLSAPVPAAAPPGRARRAPWARIGLVVAAILVLTGGGAVALVSYFGKDPAACARDSDQCATQPANDAAPAVAEVPVQSASSAAPSASASSSPSASPSASRSAAAAGPACAPGACPWPNASNTGPTGSLVRKDGNMTIRENGAVISGWDLHGMLDIYANNVTVTNCRITSKSWWGVNLRPGFTGLKVTHCEITAVLGEGPDNGYSDYGVSNMGEGTVEVGWNEITNFGNAIALGTGNVHDNYVHNLAVFINQGGEYQHTDALISSGGAVGGLVIRHNTLLNQTPIDKGASAAIGLFPDAGPVKNTTVDNNFIAGGAYALYGGDAGATNIKVTNNVFSTQFWGGCGYYGPVAHWNAGGSGNVWSNNKMSNGQPVNPA